MLLYIILLLWHCRCVRVLTDSITVATLRMPYFCSWTTILPSPGRYSIPGAAIGGIDLILLVWQSRMLFYRLSEFTFIVDKDRDIPSIVPTGEQPYLQYVSKIMFNTQLIANAIPFLLPPILPAFLSLSLSLSLSLPPPSPLSCRTLWWQESA